MGAAVTHFEVHGKDGDTLKKFYADLFDWHVDSNNPMEYGMVDTHAGNGINGGITKDMNGAAFVTIYVEVDDLQAALDKAESLGGKTVLPVTTIPDTVTLALFADPEGHVVGLVARETQAS